MHDLAKRLLELRGAEPRWKIVDRAQGIRDSDPDFAEADVERHEYRMRAPPKDGAKLRTHCAAAGLPFTEALTLIGYWPPVGLPHGPALEALRSFCAMSGLKISGWDSQTRRVVIQL